MSYNEDVDPRDETPIDETENDLCRALWIAVAMQAIIDATSKSKKKSAIKAKSQAFKWLSELADEKGDFEMVCDLAGIQCGALSKKFQQALRDPDLSVDFRCLKKPGTANRGNESRKRYFARIRRNRQLREKTREKYKSDSPSPEIIGEPNLSESQDGDVKIKRAS